MCGSCPDDCHRVSSTQLYRIFLYAVALHFAFTERAVPAWQRPVHKAHNCRRSPVACNENTFGMKWIIVYTFPDLIKANQRNQNLVKVYKESGDENLKWDVKNKQKKKNIRSGMHWVVSKVFNTLPNYSLANRYIKSNTLGFSLAVHFVTIKSSPTLNIALL